MGIFSRPAAVLKTIALGDATSVFTRNKSLIQ